MCGVVGCILWWSVWLHGDIVLLFVTISFYTISIKYRSLGSRTFDDYIQKLNP